MYISIVAFVTALLATLTVTEAVRVVALRGGVVDRPGGRRPHERPTARLGGLGIFWGLAFAIHLLAFGDPFTPLDLPKLDPSVLAVLLASGCMLAVGLYDDVHGLVAGMKLACQIAVGAGLWFAGVRVETLGLPGFGAIEAGAASLPLTVAWVVLVVNAVNLVDGLDGLACGLALVATVTAALWTGMAGGAGAVALAALAGSLSGFLWFNFRPAQIFMGDAGTLSVGTLVAGFLLVSVRDLPSSAFPLAAAALVAVPLFDVADATSRRAASVLLRQRLSWRTPLHVARVVCSPDRRHLHHRLVDSGLTPRRAVLILWLAGVAFAASGTMWLRQPSLGWLAAAVALGGFALAMDRVRRRSAITVCGEERPLVVGDGRDAAEPTTEREDARRAA